MRVPGGGLLRAVRVASVVLASAGCKDPGERSRAACEELVTTHECGEELKDTFPCDFYSTATCDLSDYFGCVAQSLTCEGGAATFESSACAEFLCPEEEKGDEEGGEE